MPNKIQTAYSYLIRGFKVFIGAVIFHFYTFSLVWNRAGENALIAYILNGAVILFVTIIDKISLNYLYKRKSPPFKSKILTGFIDYVVLDKSNAGYMKSSLYLFYIFVLVSSHILQLNPYLLEVSESTHSYFATIGYGLIILVAVDKFMGQFVKDHKYIEDCEDSQQES